MLTKQDFIEQYEQYSDEELYMMLQNKSQYSQEGQSAMDEVIESKGGIERLEDIIQQKQLVYREKVRIGNEVKKLAVTAVDEEFLQKMITSTILPPQEVQQVINEAFAQVRHYQKDVGITPRTIFGSVLGGSIGAIVGGLIWGLQLIQMQRMFFVLAFGLFILSYSLIRLFTKQSKNNTVVLIASCVSTGIAIGLGFMIYQMFGA